MKEIIVTKNEAGQRLDKLLKKYMNNAPDSFFYKMLRKKNIVLNGKKAAGREKLTEEIVSSCSCRTRLLGNLPPRRAGVYLGVRRPGERLLT